MATRANHIQANSPPKINDLYTIGVIKEVSAACATRTTIWKQLGYKLTLSQADLDIIAANNPRSVESCCLAMFTLWLQKQPNASWEELKKALVAVELKKLANVISKELSPERRSTGVLEESVGINSTSSSAVMAKISTPDEASIEFGILLMKIIRELLKNESENLEIIKDLCPYLTPKNDKTVFLFNTEQLKGISECNNLKTMFQENLRGCWRWDDFSLLKKLVNLFESSVCKELLQQYEQALDCAMKLQAIYEHCKQDNNELPEGYAKMVVIIKDKNFLDITLEEYQILKEFTAQHCEIPSYFLSPFTQASKSSLLLEWFVPLTAVSYMIEKATNNSDFFVKEGFVYLEISSNMIFDNSDNKSEVMDETSDDDACAKPSSSKKFLELLDKMNLTDKYPQKLSLRDAMTIRQETLGTIHTTDQLAVLPYLVLQKMMMCDQRCRSCLYKASTSTTKSKPTDSDSDSDSEWSNSDSDDMDENGLHPVDCMLIILHCCDDILRQDLISKLSLCQLAIPFLLPSPTDNSVTFLLWAMRSLVKSWKCNKTGGKEHRIVDYQGPIVSFLRIGNSPSSKSEILNAVIGEESKFFFNCRECQGGDCERNFVDGLVEMCCYLPSGKDTDPFTDAVIFLNLRGDAQQHPKQVEFLKKISFISVVLTVKTSIDEMSVKILQGLSEAPGGIVLLLPEDKPQNKGSQSKNLDLIRQSLLKSKSSKMKLRSNMPTLSSKLQQLLAKKFANAPPEHFTAISNCYQAAKEAGIKIDEDIEDSVNGKQYAKTIMEKVHSVRFNEVKDKMLPLQGPSLWHQWAKNDKERHRHEQIKQETSVTKYNAQIDEKKMEIRKEQINRCVALTPVMDCFIESLLKTTANVRKYYLQWLKLFLDDHSRKILPGLHSKYQETRDQLIALKECQFENNSQVKKLKEKLKIQNEELINASFGLEHLFREMGQIYEARMGSGGHEVPQSLKDKANRLPQIMAEIMDEGNALELMDGDASHVPTLWVLAVIEKLKAVCGKNAREKNGGKIFVLSVLGIQSTGKSTLLNTMFGLRFNVSAGKCTRGAYIQLLPLNNSLRQMIDCDYVLIVDTEGLRAPELQLEGLKHDIELATFVIGLADATIINIFGETPGDLDDMLQTSVHAFIRMRKIEMSPSCLFVHQNVPDVLARDKNILGRQRFYNKLNSMVQAVEKIEHCEGQYNSFDEVITFDQSNDVFYFPSLWKGDPPMAPVNIGYSESAQKLKTALVKLIHKKQICHYSLEVFKLRVKSLWEAVLQENFVFNFKNTLEVCAYVELDSQYNEWSWSLQSKMLEWEKTTGWKIKGCDFTEESKIKEVAQECIKEFNEKILSTSYNAILTEMRSFIDSSDHSEILSQWEHKIKIRLLELHNKTKVQAKKCCDSMVASRLKHAEIEKIEKGHITKIQGYIRKMVDEARKTQKKYTEIEIRQKFEAEWEKWMDDFKSKQEEIKYHEIEYEIIRSLRELLQSSDALIIEKLSFRPLNHKNLSSTLQVDEKIHLSSTKWFGFKPLSRDDVLTATKLTEGCLIKAREYLHTIQNESVQFNSTCVHKLLRDLISSVENLMKPKENSNFTFTPEYKVDLALVVCAYALDVFKQIMRKIKVDNDPIAKLHTLKNTFFTTFKNEVIKLTHGNIRRIPNNNS